MVVTARQGEYGGNGVHNGGTERTETNGEIQLTVTGRTALRAVDRDATRYAKQQLAFVRPRYLRSFVVNLVPFPSSSP